jgi:glycine cleavage system T protein (aminomethyltransferase)
MHTTHIRHAHETLGARFTDFGGWDMPLQYSGVLSEHAAVRETAGAFDVSHLGRFSVEGTGATELIRQQLCNDIASIKPGRAQYTMALNDRGGVEDDIIVWRFEEESYWVLPNGANVDEILARFRDAAPSTVTIGTPRDYTVLIAVQGPAALDAIESVIGMRPGRFRVATGTYEGSDLWVGGTGYTGERGAEIAVTHDAGHALWGALMEAGVVPCGLGARDTLRLEMGYPLWGQDLDETTTPLEAGLSWVVDWDHEFVGKEALVRQRDEGVNRRLIGFTTEGRRPPRHGYEVRSDQGTGVVTSGNISPVLGHGIGMAYVDSPSEISGLEVDIRGTWTPATVVKPPFLKK